MQPEGPKRRRNPLSAEEVANIIAHKKSRELRKIEKFKSGRDYKIQNIFNVFCCCVYLELLFCFYGPANYITHYSLNVMARYGEDQRSDGRPIVSDIKITCVNGSKFTFMISDFIPIPSRWTSFRIGRDFLLQKELKGILEVSEKPYRIFSASSLLFLSALVLFVSFGAYFYNLNENAYSLMALTVLNALTMLGILLL
jgi:hypothetical protein